MLDSFVDLISPGLETVGWPAHLGTWFFVMAAVLSLPLLVYLYTTVRFLGTQAGAADGVEPPMVPYWIPFLGHTFPFALDTAKHMAYLTDKFRAPVRVLVGGEPMYFVPHGEATVSLFRNSRQFTNGVVAERLMRDAFGLPDADARLTVVEQSGVSAQPNPGWEHLTPSHRWMHVQHQHYQIYLAGRSLTALGETFVRRFTQRIAEADCFSNDGTWTDLPDLYDYLRDDMFHAATEAIYGDELVTLTPSFARDFWAFDGNLPLLFRRVPRLLAPAAFATRDKVLNGLERWHVVAWGVGGVGDSAAHDETDYKLGPDDDEWDPVRGAKLSRARFKMYRDFSISARAAAAFDLGIMWATNANSIPTTMWMLWFVLQDDDVRARLVAEIDSCFRGSTLEVDILRLAALPLLNSVYMETLRLRAASPVGRTPVSGNYRFGRWRFRKDVPIIATSWLGGYDADFWNQGAVLPGGGGRPSHPVDDFWADRFLEHPDDPASGPIRRRGGLKETAARTTITADGVAAEKPGLAKRNTNTYADSDSTQHSQPRLVTSGMAGHWFPFGGGQNTCPGRFFAKQEVLAGAAVMLRAFEFDIADRPAWAAVAPNMAYFPFGVVPPKGKSPIRIRKRTLP